VTLENPGSRTVNEPGFSARLRQRRGASLGGERVNRQDAKTPEE
jgi:hypothetical protein